MKAVHFVIRDQVDTAFYIGDAEEVPGHIQHETAPHKTGIVPDRPAGQRPRTRLDGGTLYCRGQQLPDGLDSPEQTSRLVGNQAYGTWRYG